MQINQVNGAWENILTPQDIQNVLNDTSSYVDIGFHNNLFHFKFCRNRLVSLSPLFGDMAITMQGCHFKDGVMTLAATRALNNGELVFEPENLDFFFALLKYLKPLPPQMNQLGYDALKAWVDGNSSVQAIRQHANLKRQAQ